MILTRLLSFIARGGQFISAVIVLGLSSYFIHLHRKYDQGPLGREVYALIISILSVIVSLLFMIPTVRSMTKIGVDFVWGVAWIIVFALLVNYLHSSQCGTAWSWGNITGGRLCDRWQAAEAFSFISAMLWFLSAVIGIFVRRHVDRENAHRAPV